GCDDSVTVGSDARVACGERECHVAMAPDELVGVRAVARIRAGCVASPRIGVDSRAVVVALQEKLANVRWNADEVIAVGNPIEHLAEIRRGRPVFHGLEDEMRAW